ncbi:MAG: hypothetical protein AB7G13_11680 [Lautropia sp.]
MSLRLINRPGPAEIISGPNHGLRVFILERAEPGVEVLLGGPSWIVQPCALAPRITLTGDSMPASMATGYCKDWRLRPIDPQSVLADQVSHEDATVVL